MEDKKYLGRCGFVIGGGESIKRLIDEGLDMPKLLANEITIGTNKSHLLGRSTYHVVMDIDYFKLDKENLLKQNLHVSDTIWSNIPELKLKPIKRLGKLGSNFKTISRSFEDGLYYGRSTGYLAMNIAHVLGCNPIYLLGIDLVGYHFHEGYGQKKDLKLPREHKVIENELRSGIQELQKLGVKVISLSDTSRLNDIIPYDISILKSYGVVGPEMVNTIGDDWRDPDINAKLTALGLDENHKYRRRKEWVTNNQRYVYQWLPEYEKNKSKAVLDFSTGNGVFLEIMRYLGHTIKGTDHPDCKYKPFHESQNIPVVYFNASILPYPFPGKSYDLVTCFHALTFYKCDWDLVLNEFFRIARESVFIIVNLSDKESNWVSKRHFIDNFIPPVGWKLQYKIRSMIKWIYVGS